MKKILRTLTGCCCLKAENPKNEEAKDQNTFNIVVIRNQEAEPEAEAEENIYSISIQQPQDNEDNQEGEKQHEELTEGGLKPTAVIKRKYPPKVNISEIRETLRKSESNLMPQQVQQNIHNTLIVTNQTVQVQSEKDVKIQIVRRKTKVDNEKGKGGGT